jgi:hypothetical protein
MQCHYTSRINGFLVFCDVSVDGQVDACYEPTLEDVLWFSVPPITYGRPDLPPVVQYDWECFTMYLGALVRWVAEVLGHDRAALWYCMDPMSVSPRLRYHEAIAS